MRPIDWCSRLVADWRTARARRADERRLARALYLTALSAARDPVHYRDGGVPDSFEGRFDLLLVHVFLLADRLEEERDEKDAAMRVLRLLQEEMFADFDRLLREMGVGDMSVGRHIRNMARAWAGRADAYRTAVRRQETGPGARENALAEALLRNVWKRPDGASSPADEGDGHVAARRLARRVLRIRERLAASPFDRLEERAAAILRVADEME